MKTSSTFLKTVSICLVLFLTSCSKSSSSNDTTPTPVNTAQTSFKLDGVLITPDQTIATLYNNTVAGGQYIDVYAFKAGIQVLELHMPATVANYPAQHAALTMTESWMTYQANGGSAPADYFDSNSGSMNLTTCDLTNNKLVGTFNFIGSNGTTNKTITEGNLVVNTITHS
jgi:hypothetical protein